MERTIEVRPGEDLQALFDSVSAGSTLSFPPGEWRQKAVIRTPGLRLCGAGAEKTRLVWDDYARALDEKGFELGTFRSWTLAVCADGVHMEDLAVVNDALEPERKGQEVALSVLGDAFAMERCTLRSTQDTLFLGPLPPDLIDRYEGFLPDELRQGRLLRQHFSDCRIEGTVDFIFGCGEALFERCEIRSLYEVRGVGYAAAPAHGLSQTEGFTFRDCAFTCEPVVAQGSVWLARPWRDYGLCRFEGCTYAAHIAPEGFDKWSGTERDKTARFYETPPVPGRVPWARKG